MGVEGKKRSSVPLPAPTETESTILSAAPTDLGTDLGTDVSRAGDDKSSYSLPEDGTPVTIKTGGHRHNKSQTSLLIEYFEGGKSAAGSGTSEQRKPSIRVRVTPSSKHKKSSSDRERERDRIEITQTRSRRSSTTRRSTGPTRSEVEGLSVVTGDLEDSNSYASATEESNVSRNPIDIEIDRGGNMGGRRRRPASPLIPAADSKGYIAPNMSGMSEISAIPTDSFLDGSGPGTAFGASDVKSSRTRSPSRGKDILLGAAAGVAAASAADKLRSKSRGESRDRDRDRVSVSKTRDKDKERKHKSSKSRTSSLSKEEKYGERSKSKSSKGHSESLVSAADSSVVSSAVTPSVRSTASKASSINNPKLLETVEDAIRRLILPELNALKREQSKRGDRRGSTTSSATTTSRDEYASDRRRSSGTDKNITPRDSLKISKDRRDREARNDFEDSPVQSLLSQDTLDDAHSIDDTPMRSTDRLKAAAAGAALGAAAVAAHEAIGTPTDDKRTRRRRRAEMRSRASEHMDDHDMDSDLLAPPMPLMSDLNASDVTRASILSAEEERPHSASEELTPARQLSRGQLSAESSPTPTKNQITLQSLGTQHANVSHGDLRALPRQRTGDLDSYDNENRQRSVHDQYDDYDDEPVPMPEYEEPSGAYDYYNTQDVPPPLKYTPYQPERRGLSPIPSVSGYTEASEAPNRDSRITQQTGDSSPRSREFGDDDHSMRSPGPDRSAAGSELEGPLPGQAVRAVGANPNFVHPAGIESNVASLVEGSMMTESVLTGDSLGQQGYNQRGSMAEGHQTPTKQSVGSSHASREFVEYDVDEYGRKVPRTYRQSPTASETAITSAAVGAAAAVLRAQNGKNKQTDENSAEEWQGAGVQRNQSFKERTKNGQRPGVEPKHSVDRLSDKPSDPKLGFNGMPDPNDPMPEIGWQDDDLITNPSMLDGHGGRGDEEQWQGDATPRQHARHLEDDIDYEQLDGAPGTPTQQKAGHGLGIDGAAGAAAIATAAAMASGQHSREVSGEHDEWYRTSEDRKRDTLITNPYEGTSPIANLPGLDDGLLGANYNQPDFGNYGSRSPAGHKVDEGYISQGPNKTPDLQGNNGKGIDAGGKVGDDPFYAPTHTRHLSGMSQGMGSPLYDASTGMGIDRIESKDIIALMQHLMVRDAQRSARDTEMLVTLVHTATEMKNNFDDLKRLLADTEDVIITEVKENTEKTVQRHINGPRPYPGSAPRSIQGGSQAGTINTEDINAKKKSLFRRALKGLGNKGPNDLSRIEDMLMQLLTQVDVLKAQTVPGNMNMSGSNQGEQSYDNIQPEVQYEQDHGYEPEGTAGTSATASHASQSGHLSIQSRGTSGKPGYERKMSAHRISTVPEDNEEEYGQDHGDDSFQYDKQDMLMTPTQEQRPGSAPLGTPPDMKDGQGSMSNEHTPKTDEGKKKGRSSWFPIPKISRWSETTTSSVAQVFRRSGQSRKNEEGDSSPQTGEERVFHRPPSHSGSIGSYSDNFQFSNPHPGPGPSDKLHSGFTEEDLTHGHHDEDMLDDYEQLQPPPPMPGYPSMTPEDPKYKAHRNSLNLQHPQPRQGQTERFKTALETQAMGLGYNSPLSPKTADWDGSATSLNRLPLHEDDNYGHDDQYQPNWTSSPGAGNVMATSGGPPARPPKEPLVDMTHRGSMSATPPAFTNKRISKLQKNPPGGGGNSPLPHHSVESGYGTMTHGVPTSSYISQGGGRESREFSAGSTSPRPENRQLTSVSAGVARRPSGPRPMTPTGHHSGQGSPLSGRADERRKRDTFGTINSQDTDTF